MLPTPRRAARVLLVDGAGRILLFHGFDPGRPGEWYWFTAGGGLRPGEDAATGAARELYEETGLRVPPERLGAPVWHEVTQFPFDGVWYRQEQDYFLVRIGSWTVVTDGFDADEASSIDGHRWWAIDELETTSERYYPTELAELLRRVLEPLTAEVQPVADEVRPC